MNIRSYQPTDYEQVKILLTSPDTFGGVFDEARDSQERMDELAHSFPWSSDDGVDIVIEDDVVTVVVPLNKQSVLQQEVCVYTLADDGFVYTEEEEMGLTYHATKDVVPLSCECFASVTDAMNKLGGGIKLLS